MIFDICCLGHITLDKVVNTQGEIFMAGGTAYYFANAMANLPLRFTLVTAVGLSQASVIDQLRNKGISVKTLPTAHSVYFENIYSDNQNHRTQRVLQKADPFTIDSVKDVQANLFHLGPLLADDIPFEVIPFLAEQGKVSLDVQGLLREVQNQDVLTTDWPDKIEALKHITILKANEFELEALTGTQNIRQGAIALHNWGVQEVVITLGSKGSVIYADGIFYNIPAYTPAVVADATGCGDTYMAGYLYQRAKGSGIQQAGEFAAGMASLKIEAAGPFTGTEENVLNVISNARHQH